MKFFHFIGILACVILSLDIHAVPTGEASLDADIDPDFTVPESEFEMIENPDREWIVLPEEHLSAPNCPRTVEPSAVMEQSIEKLNEGISFLESSSLDQSVKTQLLNAQNILKTLKRESDFLLEVLKTSGLEWILVSLACWLPLLHSSLAIPAILWSLFVFILTIVNRGQRLTEGSRLIELGAGAGLDMWTWLGTADTIFHASQSEGQLYYYKHVQKFTYSAFFFAFMDALLAVLKHQLRYTKWFSQRRIPSTWAFAIRSLMPIMILLTSIPFFKPLVDEESMKVNLFTGAATNYMSVPLVPHALLMSVHHVHLMLVEQWREMKLQPAVDEIYEKRLSDAEREKRRELRAIAALRRLE